MKILIFSDLHSNFDFLDFLEENNFFNAELVLFSGDFVDYHIDKETANIHLNKILKYFKKVNFYAVLGNVDKMKDLILPEKYYLNNNIIEKNKLKISGLDFNTEAENKNIFEVDIFISHEPPYKTKLDLTYLGDHIGSNYLKRNVLLYQPKFWFCGHVHESKGFLQLGKTKVYNLGPAQKNNYFLLDI